MNYLFTAAGLGSRLLAAGVKPLKPFVRIHGKECIRHAMDSFLYEADDRILIALPSNHKCDSYLANISKFYSLRLETFYLEDLTRGQLETAYSLLMQSGLEQGAFVVHNCDSSFLHTSDILSLLSQYDVVVPYFLTEGDHWSFLRGQFVDGSQGLVNVNSLAEKKRISSFASIGTYIFRDVSLITSYFDEYVYSHCPVNSELFISPYIDFLVNKKGLSCVGVPVQKPRVFGTVPEILQNFHISFPELFADNDSIRGNQRATIVCDIDETLCRSNGLSFDQYPQASPIDSVVHALRNSHKNGAYIILYTSRNMRSFQGNLGLINKHTLPVLANWLEEHNVPYDEIVLAKPWGRNLSYVDDKSLPINLFVDRFK